MHSSSSPSPEPGNGDGAVLLRRLIEASRRAEIVTMLGSARSEPELGEIVADELCEVFEAEIGFLLVRRADDAGSRMLASIGLAAAEAVVADDRLCVAALEAAAPRLHAGRDLLGLGVRCLALSPFTAEDGSRALVGVARLYDRPFDAPERALLESVTKSAGQALERIWLDEQVEESRLALEEKAEQLAISSKYKSEFLANMSHELRTPLNSVLLLANLLADNAAGTLTSKQIQFAETIRSAGSDLLELFDDVLEFSKVEAGKLNVEPAPVSLGTICDDVEQSFRAIAEEKGLEFAIDAREGLPATITTDKRRLEQILRNLLSNAFKFTERGSVILRIGPAPAAKRFANWELSAAHDVLAFSVVDTGIGIVYEKLKVIFAAFQQADGTTSRKYGGTGLGLAISRETAHLLGGEIQVESTPGLGSAFTLYLPHTWAVKAWHHERPDAPVDGELDLLPPLRSEPEDERRSSTSSAGPEPKLEDDVLPGSIILVVEDDARSAFALTNVLESHGMRVLYAADGRQAMAVLDEHPEVDLVLLDIMMPGTDGYEMLETLRAMPQHRELPVITVTARVLRGDREKSLEAGASDYLAKPVKTEQLLRMLHLWLARNGRAHRAG